MSTGRGDYEEHRGKMGRAATIGAVSGFVAGIPMGLFLQFGTGILPVLGGLVGAPSLLWGWVINLVISVGHGVVFALVLAHPAVHHEIPIDTFAEYVMSGLVYGTLVAMVTIALLPFTMQVLGTSGSGGAGGPTNPGMVGLVSSILLAIGHLAYGGLLGALYAAMQDVRPGE